MSEVQVMLNKTENKLCVVEQKKLTRYDLMVCGLGFFMSMAMPYPGISPFGVAYLAKEKRFSSKALVTFAATMLGSLCIGDFVASAKYIAAQVLYIMTLFVLEKGVEISARAAGLIGSVALFLSGTIVMYWQGYETFRFIMLGCESVAVLVGVYIMHSANELIAEKKVFIKNMTVLEKVSLGLTAALCLMSLREIYVGKSFSIINLASALLLMIISYGGGVAVSTSSGVVIGAICGIGTDFFLPFIGAFGFCGFIAGIFSKFGKGGVAAGLVIANAVLIVYVNGAIENMLEIYEILVAGMVFAFVPMKVITSVCELIAVRGDEKEAMEKIKLGINIKLKSLARSFEALSVTLRNLSDKDDDINMGDISVMFDSTADQICKPCRRVMECWEKDFSMTYNTMFKLLEIMENKGRIEEADVEPFFKKKCIKMGKFLVEFGKQFDLYKLNQIWRNRLCENRELVGEQLEGVSQIMDELVSEIEEDVNVDMSAIREIREQFRIGGIKAKNISAVQDRSGKYHVEMMVKHIYLNGGGQKKIKDIVENVLKCELNMYEMVLDNKEASQIIFSEEEKYMVESGFASVGASEKNGDSHKLYALRNGKYVVTLSDGMGTGSRAARESEAMIELLDSFLRAGFDKRVAIKLINSIMVMKSAEQSFVTLDMCIIDLYTGEVEFLKTGAEPSYIKKKYFVETVSGASLPVGVMPDVEVESIESHVDEGDTIVMLTDGLETKENGANWIREFIKTSSGHMTAKKFADEILERAIIENGGKPKDDMTVISLRLKKKIS